MTFGSGDGQALDLEGVLPAAAVVVEITQGLGSGVFKHVDQLRLARVERSVGPVGEGRPQPTSRERISKRWLFVQPSAACSVKCSRSSLTSAGTSIRLRTLGSTSLRVTLSRRTAAVTPRDYDAGVRPRSSRAGVRRDDAQVDRQRGQGRRRARPADRRQ